MSPNTVSLLQRLGLLSVAGILVFVLINSMIAFIDAGEVAVIQYPNGSLSYRFESGPLITWFGRVTRYKRESQYWFSSAPDQGEDKDESIRIRFNDGGNATISGSVRWTIPMSDSGLRRVHIAFGNERAIQQQLIRTVIEKSVYMTGPLMSSKESYSERRNELITFIEEQAVAGVFRTKTREIRGTDLLSGKEKTITQVEIAKDEKGTLLRAEGSPIQQFAIRIYNLSINQIKYDKAIEEQIDMQQKLTMDVQTANAEAKKAEQNAIKVEKEGQSSAAQARWEQEVIKARAVTEAQQKREVAKLDMESAEYTRRKLVLEGEGEASKRRLLMQANGALDQKLAAWVEVNKAYADAIKSYQGNWVPSVQMGTANGKANGASELVDLLMAKTARDLAIDMTPKK